MEEKENVIVLHIAVAVHIIFSYKRLILINKELTVDSVTLIISHFYPPLSQ